MWLEKESDDGSVEPRGRREEGRGVGVRKKAPRLKRKGGRPRDSRAEPNVSPHCRAHCRLWRTSLPPPVRRHPPLPPTPPTPLTIRHYPFDRLLPLSAIWLAACIAACMPTCLPARLTLISLTPDLACLDTFTQTVYTLMPANANSLPPYPSASLFPSLFPPLSISTSFLIPSSLASLFSAVGLEAFSCRSFAIKLEDFCSTVCRTGARTHARGTGFRVS